MTKIKDIYAGKPDAKDEIETEGMDPFFENYVVPSNFNINAITDGSGAFVTGYKGTGKTAILFYIEKYLRKKTILHYHHLFSSKAIIQIQKNKKWKF